MTRTRSMRYNCDASSCRESVVVEAGGSAHPPPDWATFDNHEGGIWDLCPDHRQKVVDVIQ